MHGVAPVSRPEAFKEGIAHPARMPKGALDFLHSHRGHEVVGDGVDVLAACHVHCDVTLA